MSLEEFLIGLNTVIFLPQHLGFVIKPRTPKTRTKLKNGVFGCGNYKSKDKGEPFLQTQYKSEYNLIRRTGVVMQQSDFKQRDTY